MQSEPKHTPGADLIAAAPLLLEACVTAYDNLSSTYASDHIVIKRLKAVIARAKGISVTEWERQAAVLHDKE